MKTLEVVVTTDHIHGGRVGSCYYCPIALAIEEHPGVESVEVFRRYVDVTFKSGDFISYKLPLDAGWFVDRFDAYYPVDPITFTLSEKWV